MSISVQRIGSSVFVVSGINATNHALGIAARECKWSVGIDYSAPIVHVNSNRVGSVNSRTYVVIPSDTPNYGTARKRAAKSILERI